MMVAVYLQLAVCLLVLVCLLHAGLCIGFKVSYSLPSVAGERVIMLVALLCKIQG